MDSTNNGANVITFKRPKRVTEQSAVETSPMLVPIREVLADFNDIANNVDKRLRISLPQVANHDDFMPSFDIGTYFQPALSMNVG